MDRVSEARKASKEYLGELLEDARDVLIAKRLNAASENIIASAAILGDWYSALVISEELMRGRCD